MASTSRVTTRSTAGPTTGQSASSTYTDTTSASTSTKKKPYVRLITDKRREQNRRAQKMYRERLRKRLEDLEEQAAATASIASAASTTGTSVLNTPAPKSGLDDGRSWESANQDGDSLVTESIPSIDNIAAEYSQPRIIDLEDAFLAAGDLPISHNQIAAAFQLNVAPSPPAPEQPEPIHTHDDYGDIDLRPIWAMPPRKGNKQYIPRKARPSHSLVITTSNPQRNPFSQFAAQRSLADPYANNLRLIGVGSLEASISIGIHLNIPRIAYVNDHPSHFPGCYVALNSETLGPKSISYSFFQTHLTITPQLSDHMNAVKGPLKPSPAQLMNPHPCYLDCIVFPYFRDQLVLASTQGILDHEQLIMDILHGGLVCWGGASDFATSRRARKRQMSDNVAWSTRSWEAKKWFLRKWSWLIGTEEEEEARDDVHGIWKGSRWWWNMRGEVDSEEDDDEGEDDDGEDPDIGESLHTTGRLTGNQQRLCPHHD